MADREMQEPDVHEEATLLPWYLNGTLQEGERRRVAEHLLHCLVCQREIEEITLLRQRIRRVYEAEAAPPPKVFGSVMEGIYKNSTRSGSKSEPARDVGTSSWGRQLDQWLRKLLAPQWAPTAVAVAVVLQAGVVLWAVTQESRIGASDGIATRGLPVSTTQLVLLFHQEATHGQILTVLRAINGTIVDGPTSDGAYIVVIPAGDLYAVEKAIQTTRGYAEVVRTVSRR